MRVKRSLIVLVAMLLPLLLMAQNSGECGDNLTWTFDESNGTLVISGEGKMKDYQWWSGGFVAPWFYLEVTKVVIKNGVSYIGESAFSKSGLAFIDIPSSVTSIGSHAFESCTNLSSVTIPSSVTSIGADAFCNSGLISIDIPSSVTSIGIHAFQSCTNLSSVTIPNSVTSIGSYTFTGCTNLSSVTIPNSVTSIGSNAFGGCASLESIIIPDGVTSIKDKTFSGCTSLNSITIPNGVTSIGSCAFEGCSSLTSFTIPQGMIRAGSIGDEAFKRFSGLVSIDIPDGITSLGADAFRECNNLKSVTFGKDVESIGSFAFAFCNNLKEVVIPDNVTVIERGAFLYCENLESVSIGDGVTVIKKEAFNNCLKISRLILGKSVKTIGEIAFPGLGLIEVTCFAADPPTTESQNFRVSSVKDATLFVQGQSIEAYKVKDPWKNFKEIVAIEGTEPVSVETCTMPAISFLDGKLEFESNTDGAECHYEIKVEDAKEGMGSEVHLSSTYEISVYASKEGYNDSPKNKATLYWIYVDPITTGLIDNEMRVNTNAVLVQNTGSSISISGVGDGADVMIYNISGQLIGQGKATGNRVEIGTNLSSDDICIIKIADRSVKYMLR